MSYKRCVISWLAQLRSSNLLIPYGHKRFISHCSRYNHQQFNANFRNLAHFSPITAISTNLCNHHASHFYLGRKFFSTEPHSNNEKSDLDPEANKSTMPLLMDFVPRGMPNFIYSLKNLYLINFVLRNHIDKGFQFKNFIEGAKQALVMVSSHLANNRLDELSGLVDMEALKIIKENYKKLTVSQRKELEMKKSDIVLSFAHHIRIQTLKEDFTGTSKHIVHFFIVFDCIRNLEETLREKASARANARDVFEEFAARKYICNYEFKREYIEGSEPTDWVITKLLHISEKDLITLRQRM